MKSLNTLVEQALLPIYLMEIGRADMPQVRSKDVTETLRIFDNENIKYEKGRISCAELKPTQEDYNPIKVGSMKGDLHINKKINPIFVSSDGYILDGHHRWLACKEAYGEDYLIPCIKIAYPKNVSLYMFSNVANDVNEGEKNKNDKNLLLDQVEKVVAVFSGRFQPFHSGHYFSYDYLVKKFGKENVYVATSNIVNPDDSPFNFAEKRLIMSRMFGIPKDKIVLTKNPYKAEELLKKFDPKKTAYVAAVGVKDESRLTGKYFKKWTGTATKGFEDEGYVITVPQLEVKVGGKTISGSQIRKVFGSNVSVNAKKTLFKKLYGKFDPQIYDLIVNKLNESIILSGEVIETFIEKNNIKKIITESSMTDIAVSVDDGPSDYYRNKKEYDKRSGKICRDLGWQIVDYLTGEKNGYVDETYKYDTEPFISPGKVGVYDYPGDVVGKYKRFIEKAATSVGYRIVDWLLGDESGIITENAKKEYRQLLLCGGAYGHLAHPFEDWSLTFGDLKTIIDAALQGKLEVAAEKTDGQNILISWKNGKLVAARNKSHLKNFGENALDKSGISQMFSGRGEIQNAFVFAVDDLENAISKLTEKQRNKIFQEGKKFMSLEVIYPQTANVIPYGFSMLLFHGSIEYDENGMATGGSKEDARILSGMIKQVNQNTQKHFNINDVPKINLSQVKDFSRKKNKYFAELSKLQKQFNLKDTDQITLYHQRWWENFITEKSQEFGYELPNNLFQSLVNRWAFGDKSYGIRNVKGDIPNEDFANWVINFDKKDHDAQMEENMKPFEVLFLKLGVEVLKNLNTFLTNNPDVAVQKIKDEFDRTIKELEKAKDVKKMEEFRKQLERLNAIGGIDAVVPAEGITFMYNGKLFKLTGAFAPLNRLLGITKFIR